MAVFLLNLIIFLFLPQLQAIAAAAAQAPGKCSGCCVDGLVIRPPFRLKPRSDDHQAAAAGGHSCVLPRYYLSCAQKRTWVDLSPSLKLPVKYIDYASHVIHTSYPDLDCFTKHFPDIINLSSCPFRFAEDYSLTNFSLFQCSSTKPDSYSYAYPIDPSGKVYAIASYVSFVQFPMFSCKKICEIYSFPDISHSSHRELRFKWSQVACQTLLCNPEISHSQRKTADMLRGLFLLPITILALYCVFSWIKIKKDDQAKIKQFLEHYISRKPARYSYADVKKITNKFKHKIGQGGYGTVYKGKLSNDVHVAVKILDDVKGNGEEFINEVGTIGRIHHINIVRLVGFCVDGFRRALIYEFLPNYSLEKFISSDKRRLSLGWEKLQDIALGVARGVEYLHQGCDQQILHFDIKPNNVLLDHRFNPKISHFGLAKLCSKEQSVVSMTVARGTIGYIAPEVFSRNFGNVSFKSDVYSFGMLLLEMVGVRQNNAAKQDSSESEAYFPEWIYGHLEQGVEAVPGIQVEQEEDARIARKLIIVGLWCTQWYPMHRPSMKDVVRMLEGDDEGTLRVPPGPHVATNPFITKEKISATVTSTSYLEIISESE
ncbi:rust resistance kinase Lr10-like [Diospyros lotus]|uniref:rust resistance kinase Lr10-like n=1 Tax=Diospyros lotus TaxID=55363 RepID=UPI00224FF142|nr:rust resistance kinase Lr10-like [Diospyros lotus]